MYTNVNVNIPESQKEKLRKALVAGSQLSLRLSHADLTETDVIAEIRRTLVMSFIFCHGFRGQTSKNEIFGSDRMSAISEKPWSQNFLT